jgi:DNA-binding MarR family transcriptional regulator
VEEQELVALIGRRWNILSKLSKRKYYVGDLASELDRSAPQISYELSKLKQAGLLESEENGEKNRRKYYFLSNYGERVVKSIFEAVDAKPSSEFEDWKISEFLEVLGDQNMSEQLRESYAQSFNRLCREYPEIIFRNEKAVRILEDTARNPVEDKVSSELKKSVKTILRKAHYIDEGKEWASETIYPILKKNLKSENEKTFEWTIGLLSEFAISLDRQIRREIEEYFVDMWFSEGLDLESNICGVIKQGIMTLFSKDLLKTIKKRMRNPREKMKSEILLEDWKAYMLP